MKETELQALLRSNPEVKATGYAPRGPLTPAAKEWLAADGKKLEERFLAWWQAIGGPELEREYRFAPDRQFRADFAHLGSKVIIEIDGGLYLGGALVYGAASRPRVTVVKHYLADRSGGMRVVEPEEVKKLEAWH